MHVRLLDVGYFDGDRVEFVGAAVQPTRLWLRCVTSAPDSEPCGTVGGTTLIDVFENDRDPSHPPEFAIEVEADNAGVPQPTLDRR